MSELSRAKTGQFEVVGLVQNGHGIGVDESRDVHSCTRARSLPPAMFLRTDEPPVGEDAHLAFWVAVALAGQDEEIIGTLGLRRVGDETTARIDTAENSGLPLTDNWISNGDVCEIRRLRVAQEWRRGGVATALSSAKLS